jgi:ribonucleoside-diphosphate reductase alpha chain
MNVVKRSGATEPVSFDKILQRIQALGADLSVDLYALCKKVIDQLHDGITTTQLDELAAEQCATQNTEHPDYGTMAARLVISNHTKETVGSFSEAMEVLAASTDIQGEDCSTVSTLFIERVRADADAYNAMVCDDRDLLLTYFGFKTLHRSYLLKSREKGVARVVERPQYMWLRVAMTVCSGGLDAVRATYDLISTLQYTHATPTLYNAGTPHQQLSSCYLLAMQEDSIEGIFETLKQSALISKWAGGQGLHVHNIRGKSAHIRGTNGVSNGLVPMLRVFNNMARYVDQGGGKRPGAVACYLSPDHIDVLPWLEMRRNNGNEDEKARDLFYGLWIPDLFMSRVASGGTWTMMCPDSCPGLADAVGEEYVALYESYERDIHAGGRSGKSMPARDVWFRILDSQIETGTPYMLYKDAANIKSNQKNLGTIKSSNLCTEIIEYSSPTETAVCNLASIALPAFVIETSDRITYDFAALHAAAKVVAKNLDHVIDINFYPVKSTELSNRRHRPIGIGVQGLADVFIRMRLPYESEGAAVLNREIFETIYHAAIEASWELALTRKQCPESSKNTLSPAAINNPFRFTLEEQAKLPCAYAGAYSSYLGSPMSKGQFQFDLWGVRPSSRYDWDDLRERVQRDGIRNSLSLAPMPTASTAQILGNNEAFEPITSNMYVRRVGPGDFPVINKYLVQDLIALGKWDGPTKDSMIERNGSVQHLDIPVELKELYKTAWEMKMKSLIDLSVGRAPFVCQSQSLNLWMESPDYAQMTAMHMHAWRSGLKTGMYYLRTRAKAAPQQFTVAPTGNAGTDEPCEMCSA